MAGSRSAYEEETDAFLAEVSHASGRSDPVDVYHAVRNFRYASRGERDPSVVLREKCGSCSGKHILLRDLLRKLGQKAEIETAEGDFAAGIGVHPSMPDALQAIVSKAGIRDFHQYVVWDGPAGEVKLDATWPDGAARFGVVTNTDWNGRGDTRLALEPVALHGRHEDVVAHKQTMLHGLSEAERTRRLEFLALLSDWFEALEREGQRDERLVG